MKPSLRASSASRALTRDSIAANLASKASMSTDATGSTDHSAPPTTWLPLPPAAVVDTRYQLPSNFGLNAFEIHFPNRLNIC